MCTNLGFGFIGHGQQLVHLSDYRDCLGGIGKALDLPVGMVAGAVISGAYFGDKLSPLSDTTNLAPAMAGSELFAHIRYMLSHPPLHCDYPFVVYFFGMEFFKFREVNTSFLSESIREKFNITPGCFWYL